MSFLQFNLVESGIKHFLWFLAPDRMSKIYLKNAKKKEKKKKTESTGIWECVHERTGQSCYMPSHQFQWNFANLKVLR